MGNLKLPERRKFTSSLSLAIYAVVEGFAVTARLRLQLVAEAPFIR
jgi:hypothetical protein